MSSDTPPSTVSRCPNCATALAGPFCHACGQQATPTERSLFRLLFRWLREAFDADGRLVRSFVVLVARPGRLSRSYMDGQRNRYLGPLKILGTALFSITVLALALMTALDITSAVVGVSDDELEVVDTFDRDRIPSSYPRVDLSTDEGDGLLVFGPGFHYYRFNASGTEVEEYVEAVSLDPDKTCVGAEAADCMLEEYRAVRDSLDAQRDFAEAVGSDGPGDTQGIVDTFLWVMVITTLGMIPVLRLLSPHRRTWVDATVLVIHATAASILSILALMAVGVGAWLLLGADMDTATGIAVLLHGLIVPGYVVLALRGHFNLSWGATLWRAPIVALAYWALSVVVGSLVLRALTTLSAMNEALG